MFLFANVRAFRTLVLFVPGVGVIYKLSAISLQLSVWKAL